MHRRLATLLLGALAAVALLGAATVAVSALALHRESEQVAALRNDALLPMQDLKALSDAYAVSVVDASHKVRNGNFTFAQGMEALAEAQRIIDRAWRRTLAASLSPAALEHRPQARSRKDAADALVADLSRIMQAEDRPGLDRLVIDRLYAAIDPLTEAIGAMLDAQVAASVQEAEATTEAGEAALGLVMLLSGIGLAVIGGIGVLVQRRVIRPVHALTAAMEQMAAGRLDTPVPEAARGDEIGEMARTVLVFQQGLLEGEAQRAAAATARARA